MELEICQVSIVVKIDKKNRLLQTRVFELIGKFFLQIAWTHCFKDFLLNDS